MIGEDPDPDEETEIDEDAMGEPLALLGELAQEPRAGFIERVRAKIERRRLGAQTFGLAWKGVAAVFVEFLSMLFSLVGRPPRGNGEKKDE